MEKEISIQGEKRQTWIDWLRVSACFMVFVVHSTEPFYLGGEGALILTPSDVYWAAFFDSFVRACVPLFIIASSYLQFPLHYSTGEFVRRRAVRILVPFIIWTLVYALVLGEPMQNLHDLVYNFNYAAGHLWFVYMLLGVYVIMPLLSPWAAHVSRRELEVYLILCLFTTTFPLLRDYLADGELTVIYGPSGLPRQAVYPLWGECSWNAYGIFYYLCGFIGYLLLGLYFRRFVGEWSWHRTIAVAFPVYLVGFGITFGGFVSRAFESAACGFPVGGPVSLAVWWETTWTNDTIGVALMAIAWILFFRKINAEGRFYRHVLLPVSNASYGIYLMHLLILVPMSGVIRESFGIGTEGHLGILTTPVEILLSSVSAFILVTFISHLLHRIPKLGKYIIG
ncbi:MAG: acyltransferase family protein [Bacteroidales bacterium]|nr:acyltransferase family protein [Bacteroidales bacterium]